MELPKSSVQISKVWILISLLAIAKLVIHLLTNTNYGLHRDAYLYIAQSEHLAWGYISVPPFTATLVQFSRWLFGDSVFALRLFPALAGAINIFLIGFMVKEMRGKYLAIVLTCSAYLLSPAFLRSNSLIQPVSYNQMFWILLAYLIVKLIATRDPKYWLGFGLVAGIGFLNKFSILFFMAGLSLALLATTERKWLTSRFLYLGAMAGILIALPNLLWQYNHSWPIISHMKELRETQLVHVSYSGFLIMQLLMNVNVILIWLAGFVFYFLMKEGKEYRVLGYTFVFSALILLFLQGKPYYTLGLYPILFAGGGIAFEKCFSKRFRSVPYFVLGFMVLALLPVLPFSLPVYSHQKMVSYGEWATTAGMKDILKWEDGEYYPLPQDYADMIGWEEMVAKTADCFHALPADEQQNCFIFGGSYGHAGALNFYRKKYNLPEPVSFSGSFVEWAPDTLSGNLMIGVFEDQHKSSPYFRNVQPIDSVENPYARDRGYIHLYKDTIGNWSAAWKEIAKDQKIKFSRKMKRVEKKLRAARQQNPEKED